MKAFLLVLVLAAAGYGAYQFYLRDHPLSWAQVQSLWPANASSSPVATPAAKKDFKDLDARLQGDMDHIPVSLRDARQIPSHAFDTKSRIAPYLQLHAEYVTLNQACDLIIEADQAFTEHQQKCGFAPAALGANAQERARAASAANSASPAVYQQQQTIWDNQRKQSDGRVRQLLATLDNKQL